VAFFQQAIFTRNSSGSRVNPVDELVMRAYLRLHRKGDHTYAPGRYFHACFD
jgi:hypothetical protein